MVNLILGKAGTAGPKLAMESQEQVQYERNISYTKRLITMDRYGKRNPKVNELARVTLFVTTIYSD